MIVADSCIWIDFLSGRDDHGMAHLLNHNEVAVTGTVLAQVLSGVRGEKKRRALEQSFLALPYVTETREVFLKAAAIYAFLRARGITVPLSDCTIAAVCLLNDVPLLTTDHHFDQIADLPRA